MSKWSCAYDLFFVPEARPKHVQPQPHHLLRALQHRAIGVNTQPSEKSGLQVVGLTSGTLHT